MILILNSAFTPKNTGKTTTETFIAKNNSSTIEDAFTITIRGTTCIKAIAATRLKKSFSGNIKDMSAKKEKEYRETYEAVYQEKLKKRYPNWKDNPELLNRIESISREKADKTIRIMKTLESNKSNLTTL